MDKPYEIKDNRINRFKRIFSKYYYAQGIVYMTGNNPSIVGNVVKWLDDVCVRTTSQKRAYKLMFDFFNEKYPEYKNYVQLF